MNRPKRANAGVNNRYDGSTYCLVSFPDHEKHALVPSRIVNMDPIDARAATLKIRGIRRHVRLISSGSQEEMKRKASNFSSQTHSEEVDINDQCEEVKFSSDDGEYQTEPDGQQPSIHRRGDSEPSQNPTTSKANPVVDISKDNDDIDIRPQRSQLVTPIPAQRTTSLASPSTTSKLDFSMIYGSKTSSKRIYSSSESVGDSADEENNDFSRPSGKKAKVKHNVDLTKPIRRQRTANRKRLTQSVAPAVNDSSNTQQSDILMRIERLEGEVSYVKASVKKLRRQQVIARTKPCELLTAGDVVSTQFDLIHERIQEKFNVDVRKLKSPKNRPTMLMRELFRLSGYVDDWKSKMKSNEELLKEFLSTVCAIDAQDFDVVWDMVIQSLTQMPYDQKSNANKKRTKESGDNASSTINIISTTSVVSNQSANQDIGE